MGRVLLIPLSDTMFNLILHPCGAVQTRHIQRSSTENYANEYELRVRTYTVAGAVWLPIGT